MYFRLRWRTQKLSGWLEGGGKWKVPARESGHEGTGGEVAWRVLEAFVPPDSRFENSFSIGHASQLLSHWDDCGDSESGLRGYPLAAVPDPAKMDLDLATIPL